MSEDETAGVVNVSPAERQFWMSIRQALLMALDAIERLLGVCPRTSEIRRAWRKKEE